MDLEHYLNKLRMQNKYFTIQDLRKKFPKQKEKIAQYKFLGLIAPKDIEYPFRLYSYVVAIDHVAYGCID